MNWRTTKAYRLWRVKVIQISLMVVICVAFTACAFTDSALKYSYEGTKRVNAGYEAKAKMTKQVRYGILSICLVDGNIKKYGMDLCKI